jgi:uncharacterized protein YcfL
MRQIISILFIAVILGACTIKPNTYGTGTGQIEPNSSWQNMLKVDNPKLAQRLFISNVLSRKTNDLLDVNLEITSTYKKTQNLQYQFSWFDKQGFVIEQDKEPWKSVSLHGNQIVNVGAIAPNSEVAKFKLYVREVNEEVYRF